MPLFFSNLRGRFGFDVGGHHVNELELESRRSFDQLNGLRASGVVEKVICDVGDDAATGAVPGVSWDTR